MFHRRAGMLSTSPMLTTSDGSMGIVMGHFVQMYRSLVQKQRKILSLAITLDIEKSMNAEYLDVPVNHTLQSYIHTLTKNGVMVGGSSGKFFS